MWGGILGVHTVMARDQFNNDQFDTNASFGASGCRTQVLTLAEHPAPERRSFQRMPSEREAAKALRGEALILRKDKPQ